MTVPEPHPMIPEALSRLRAFVATLTDDLLDDDPPPEHVASLIGVLLAGLHASYLTNSAGTEAAVLQCAYGTTQEHPTVLVGLDRMRTVGPRMIKRGGSALVKEFVQQGAAAAYDAIKGLPGTDERVEVSQQIGAMIGTLVAIVARGGYDNTLFDAIVATRRAITQRRELTEAARVTVRNPPGEEIN